MLDNGGFDAFLAVREVGKHCQVIGVDMTPAMVSKARSNAETAAFSNVEFRLGEIEHLPVTDCSVDVIISNCVINLSPDKAQVFREAYRVLRPGGRLAISDVVATEKLPDDVKDDPHLHACCVAGAALVDELQVMLEQAVLVYLIQMHNNIQLYVTSSLNRQKQECVLVMSAIRLGIAA